MPSRCGQRGKVSLRRVMSSIMPIRHYLSMTEKSIKSRNIPKMMIKIDCATEPTALLVYRRLASQACSWWSGRLATCEFLGLAATWRRAARCRMSKTQVGSAPNTPIRLQLVTSQPDSQTALSHSRSSELVLKMWN